MLQVVRGAAKDLGEPCPERKGGAQAAVPAASSSTPGNMAANATVTFVSASRPIIDQARVAAGTGRRCTAATAMSAAPANECRQRRE
jgi:hypothetical protein